MQRLEVSGVVQPIYGSLGVKRLMDSSSQLCFFTSLSSFNFASINIYLYKVTPSVF